jgi:16S rRNA (guanine966-N2)-methyltransferase
MPRSGEVRIIAGRWRGRRLPVPPQPGLRPTSDRVRETLFNWLQPVIEGARCLDPFAGSGAIGFEGASRGASRVVMIDRSPAVARLLRDNARVLRADRVRVVQADALRWLSGAGSAFDIVFLDPPFASGLAWTCCGLLDRNGWLAPGARIYLETPATEEWPALAAGWRIRREKTAGRVRFGLVELENPRRTPDEAPERSNPP